MKRKLLPVLLLCAALLTPSLPAAALEEGAPIALSIRPTDGTPVEEDGCIHVSSEEAAAGKTLHFGVYIESESAEMSLIGVRVHSDDPALTIVPDSVITAKDVISETPITYVIGEDNVTFSTELQPYCLGKLNSAGGYLPDCFSFMKNVMSETDLYAYWMFGTGNAEAFLGGRSDVLSFFTFDMALAPGTAPGTYSVEMLADPDEPYQQYNKLTTIEWDAGDGVHSDYRSANPTLKGISVVVDGSGPEDPVEALKGDVDRTGIVNASDAAAVLQYAAKVGAGSTDITQEEHDWMKQIGDVNGDGAVNAKDANGILRYAASVGINIPVTWEEIFA